jgi:two-component system, OmpR family, phosphate regulon sensor histidine kinase PhoR
VTTSQSGRADADELERRYAELFDLAPVGYLVKDLDGTVVEANATAGELLAREPATLVGEPLLELVGPEHHSPARALLGVAAGGGRGQDEMPFVLPDQRRARLLVNVLGPAAGGSDRIRWSLAEAPAVLPSHRGKGRDVEAALSVQRQRLATLLDRLHHAVVVVRPSLEISYANTTAAELLGARAGFAGQALVDPWPEPSLRAMAAAMFEYDAEPADARVTVDDEPRTYEILALPPDPSGEALLLIADVTAADRRRRAEREFVANAAHQLRTPVSAIASAIEVLQGGAKEDPEARDRFLAHLDRQALRLVHLTRALLILARAQALSEAPAVEVVRLRPLLEGLAGALRPGAGVEVRVECPPDLAALANQDLLEQALGNLGENAAKYTVEGEIVLCAEDAPDRKVNVVVSDTGPGGDFPSDGRFDRFYRDPAAQGEGFGLGLAIAAEAVRVLGGELRIESADAGTRVEVTLPAATVRRP